MKTKKHDIVNHPSHYLQGKFEVIDIIEDQKLGFHDGNAIKYILRHRYKGKSIEDLQKAIWYLNRLIENIEKNKKPTSDLVYKVPRDSELGS